MISRAVISQSYDSRSIYAIAATKLIVDCYGPRRDASLMMDSAQLLARLEDANVKSADMARVLNLPSSRIAEIRGGRRQIKLDEAAKLVRAFNLEEAGEAQPITPLTTPVARLLVLHVSHSVGVAVDDSQVAELAADLRAFATFVADPQVRDSVQAADGFLSALRYRKRAPKAS